jgi:DNA repair protein RadC
MKKMESLPKFDRPREKLEQRGVKSLYDEELVAILIGSGIKGKGVFEISKTLTKLLKEKKGDVKLSELEKIEGIGKSKACQIVAAIELTKRLMSEEENKISNARDVERIVSDLKNKKQEYFVILTLDGANNLIQRHTVFVGTLNQSIVHPREIFANAITDHAASIIFIHNHPSGNLKPSDDDIKTTSRLIKAGKIMGIKVLDHIIVSKKGYFSFNDNGLI